MMADKLWDMANILTGFAVAQSLATIFALAKHELLALKGRAAHWMAFFTTLVFTVFYIAAIVWCGYRGSHLDSVQPEVWCQTTWGRVGAVVLFTSILLLTLLGHWRDEISRR